MDCQEIRPLLHAYADGELDLVRSMEIERHSQNCPACARESENIHALSAALRSANLYIPAPERFRSRIRASVGSKDIKPVRIAGAPWSWLKFGLPLAACAAVALVVLLPTLSGFSANDRLAQEIVSSHIRSLMVSHLTDVASSDQHTVKPWYDGKLDFAPQVVDGAEHGFPLVGGRLDYVQDRPVVALVYRRNKHLINVFIWPEPPALNSSSRTTIRHGYNLIHWNSSGMTYWAVSDLNPAELQQLANLIQGESVPATSK